MSSTQPEAPAGTYIYCVARADAMPGEGQALGVPGIGGKPVRAIPYSDLAAIVSDSPLDSYDLTQENLLAHEQVVERTMERSDVLPVSFGTVAEDDRAVQQQLLAAAFDDLHQGLDVVHGRVEVGVKVVWEKDRLLADLAAEDETIRALRDEIAASTHEETYDQRTQLGELVAAAIEQKRDQDAEAVLSALQPLAADVRVNPIIMDLMVLNAAFLVEKQQVPAFEAQVNALQQSEAGRLIVQYSGVLPPYNFVSLVPAEGEQDAEVAR